MLLVEKPIADTHCSRFHSKRLEPEGTIEVSSPDVLGVDAEMDLKHPFLTCK